MAVTSGTSADVSIKATSGAATATKVINATGWTMQRSGTEGAYASNNTGGNRRRVVGTKDATGTISGVYDPDDPIEADLAVGSQVYVQFHTTSTKGHKLMVRITGGPDYGGDIESGEPAKWTCNWACDDAAPVFNTTLIAPT